MRAVFASFFLVAACSSSGAGCSSKGAQTIDASFDVPGDIAGGFRVWAHATKGGGRAICTEMGHTIESYADPLFRQHLGGTIRWAAGD